MTAPHRSHGLVRFASAFVTVLLLATATAAQPTAGRPSVMTASDLSARLNDPALVLLHVGDEAKFTSAHIPGARHVTPMMLSTPRGEGRLTLELPELDDLRGRLMTLGIGSGSTVVVYYADDWVSQATRIVFTLDAAGLGGQTHLLDGGLAAWRAAGHAVADTPSPPARPSTDLTLALRPGVVVKIDEMQALTTIKSGTRVVDARAPEFYTGASDRRGEIPRPGHIPGAISLPYTTFFARAAGGETGPLVLKPRAELEAMFLAAGLTPGTSLVTYCHIGQQATVPFLVARLLGYDVRLYDGSFDEWSANASVPVEKE